MSSALLARALPVLMLVVSNIFMTFAWYGRLKFKQTPILIVILASWGIALFEYCLAVPANRLGSTVYSAAQLKGMQEVITLSVFAVFSVPVSGPEADGEPRHRLCADRGGGMVSVPHASGGLKVFRAPKQP